MPRSFRVESNPETIFSINQSENYRRAAKETMTNQELAQSNQRLQARIQKLTIAYQSAEQQNVMLRDRCLRLQNRIDEFKSHLSAIKTDVGQRVAPLRLIAGHLYEVASFLESLDNSIEAGSFKENPSQVSSSAWCTVPDKADHKKIPLETISESAEGIAAIKFLSSIIFLVPDARGSTTKN